MTMNRARSRGAARRQRQLRVGEELRHALAEILGRGELPRSRRSDGVQVTVTEVRVSPDLSNATVFVMPLGGGDRGDARARRSTAPPPICAAQSRARCRLRFAPRAALRSPTARFDAGRAGSSSCCAQPEVAPRPRDDRRRRARTTAWRVSGAAEPVDGWLVIDKPVGHDLDRRRSAAVRRLFDAAKVGHGGTLDPLATGVLPIALGEATKTVALS